MSFTNFLVVLLQTGIVAGIALVGCLAARNLPALRLAICRIALLTLAGLLVWRPWLSDRPRPIVPIRIPTTLSSPTETVTSAPRQTAAAAAKPVFKPASNLARKPLAIAGNNATYRLDPDRMLKDVWALGSLVILLSLGGGLVSLSRLRRRSRSIEESSVVALVARLASEASIRPPALVESGDAAGLFVAGLVRPTIFFPIGMSRSLPEDELEAVLRHEIAHVAHGDLVWGAMRRLVVIALWWQPLVWLFRRPMDSAAEELCDRHVLATGFPQAKYADCLLRLQGGAARRRYPALAIGAVSGKSSLATRIESILDASRSRATRLSRIATGGVGMAAFAIAFCAPMVFSQPRLSTQKDDLKGWFMHPYAERARIVDENDRTIEGASAWLVVSGPNPATAFPVRVSGFKAEVTPDSIPEAWRGSLVVYKAGRAIGFQTLWPAPKRVDRVVLGASHTISGKALADGVPVAGIRFAPVTAVSIRFSDGLSGGARLDCIKALNLSAVTDKSGRFEIHDMPATAQISIDHDSERYGTISGAVSFNVPKTGNNPETTIYLHPAALVTGTVTWNGKPVPNVRVGAQGTDDNSASAFDNSNASGRFTLRRLPPGTYNVAVDIPDALQDKVTAIAQEGLKLKAGQSAAVDFQLIPGAVIRGRVTDESGAPAKKVHVGIYGPAHPRTGAWVQSILTDDQGRYQTHVPAGKQYVYCEDLPGQGNVDVIVADGATKTVDIHASRQASNAGFGDAVGVETPAGGEVFNNTIPPPPPVRTPPTMSFGPGAPFYGPTTLPNGATVRLAYVQDDFRGAHTPWSPDGSPASASDIARSLDMVGFGERKPDQPRSIFLRVDIDGVPRGDSYCVVEVPHPSDWNPWQTYGDQHDQSMDMASFRAPITLRQTDMKFGVAAGPYRTFAKAGIGDGPLAAKVNGKKPEPPQTLVGQATCAITINFPQELEGKDVRLDAFDALGKKLELCSWENDSNKTPDELIKTRTYGFTGAAPSEIASVSLMVRDYQWVTFKGIHLYPDGKAAKP